MSERRKLSALPIIIIILRSKLARQDRIDIKLAMNIAMHIVSGAVEQVQQPTTVIQMFTVWWLKSQQM